MSRPSRADAARRWLARPTHHLTADAQAEIAAEVLAVIGDPRFAPLFGPGSRAEVPLSGEIGGQLITGQIDRLLVSEGEVTVLDYKSDRPVPPSADFDSTRLPAPDGGLPGIAARHLPQPNRTLRAALDGRTTAYGAG